jgi:TP901 family phage tail tape measure protein
MAKKAFEMHFQIGGKLASSFSNVFSKASRSLGDLKNEARQTQRALDQLGNDFRKGKIHQTQYAESTERLTRELKQLENAQNRINAFNTTVGNGFNTVKATAGIAAIATAAAATAVAFKTVDTAGSFQQQMTKVGVKAEATAAELKALNDTALNLGANSSLSASEVAIAMDELAAKGFNANKIVGAMPGIIAAAESSGEDLAMTSDVVTSALNAFELQAEQANHVADVMAMSANRTAAGIKDLGYSFKYAAPIAKTLGISLEELAASTGIMVDKGLSGEQAGTSLRMALIRLTDAPKEAQKAMKKLNFTAIDSKGKFKSLAQITKDWNKSTKGLTDAQKVQTAATVFGTEAATGMLNLFSSGPEKIDEMTKALENSTGAAAEAAKAMKDNYAGSLEELGGSIETAQIKFATPILPVFQELFDGIGATLDEKSNVFERAGQRVASGLNDIFDPFSTQKPEMPAFAQNADSELKREQLSNYQTELDKFNKFSGMDFGDKIVYSLDEATVKIEQWLSGPGGDSMNKIFAKVGEIAAKAWWGAFSGAVTSSASNFMEGNFAAGAGLGVVANLLTGGLLVKGAWGAGKWGIDKVKGAKGGPGAPKPVVTPSTSTPATPKTTAPKTGGKVVNFPNKAGGAVSKGGSGVFKKVLGPLGTLFAFEQATSGANGLMDWAFGHKEGGIKPGGLFNNPLTTEKWGDSKTGAIPDWFKATFGISNTAKAASIPVPDNRPHTRPTPLFEKAPTQVGNSFNGVKSSADKVKTNLDQLTTQADQASGWLGSLNNIQTAGQKVVKALENLETRINNVQLPGTKSRVSYE